MSGLHHWIQNEFIPEAEVAALLESEGEQSAEQGGVKLTARSDMWLMTAFKHFGDS